MGIYQFDPEPDPHFRFLCEHGACGVGKSAWDTLIDHARARVVVLILTVKRRYSRCPNLHICLKRDVFDKNNSFIIPFHFDTNLLRHNCV